MLQYCGTLRINVYCIEYNIYGQYQKHNNIKCIKPFEIKNKSVHLYEYHNINKGTNTYRLHNIIDYKIIF